MEATSWRQASCGRTSSWDLAEFIIPTMFVWFIIGGSPYGCARVHWEQWQWDGTRAET